MFLNLSGRLGALALALVIFAAVCAPAPAAADEGIANMTCRDWNDMWGFYKRGLAECWLASKRDQAARTLSQLNHLQQLLGETPSAARDALKTMQTEAKSILECRLTPRQMEEAVNRFYEAPDNAKVLLGDALHAVVTARAR